LRSRELVSSSTNYGDGSSTISNRSAKQITVPMSFRQSFYAGLAVALLAGLFFLWLWRPERQLQCHSQHLLRAIEKRDWTRFASFISADYQDQWGNNHALVLEKTREVFGYVRTAQLTAIDPAVSVTNKTGYWRAKILVEGRGELMTTIKERVNSLASPFQLEWRRISGKPWDWKLIRVSNADLVIPSEFQ
jgi:hypothetical protein